MRFATKYIGIGSSYMQRNWASCGDRVHLVSGTVVPLTHFDHFGA